MIAYRLRPKTDLIILHDTHTVPGKFDIVNWLKVEGRRQGLLGIGYHAIITQMGRIIMTRPLHTQGSHTRGFNHRSIGVVLEGGRMVQIGGFDGPEPEVPHDNFTPAQKVGLQALLIGTVEPLYGRLPLMGHSELGHHKYTHAGAPCPFTSMDKLRDVLMAPKLL